MYRVLLLIYLLSTPAIAEQRAPHYTSLCTAIFLTQPETTTQHQDLQNHLSGLNAEILEHFQRLDDTVLTSGNKVRKFLYDHTPSRLIDRLVARLSGQRDFAAPHDREINGVFEDSLHAKWKPSHQSLIHNLVGRVAKLEHDFTSNEISSFGYEVRGTQFVVQYIKALQAEAAENDKFINSVMDKEKPFFTWPRAADQARVAVFPIFFGIWLPPVIARHLEAGEFFDAAVASTVLAFVAFGNGYDSLKQVGMFVAGNFSKDMRARYENKYMDFRARSSMQYLEAVTAMAQSQPSVGKFAYNALNAYVPESYLRKLYHALKHSSPVAPEEMLAAVRRNRRSIRRQLEDAHNDIYQSNPIRYIMLDQVFYFDEKTLEPVFVSFIRSKNTIEAGVPLKDSVQNRIPEDQLSGN